MSLLLIVCADMLIRGDSWLVRRFPTRRAAMLIDLCFAVGAGAIAFVTIRYAYPNFDPVVAAIIGAAFFAETVIVSVILRDQE